MKKRSLEQIALPPFPKYLSRKQGEDKPAIAAQVVIVDHERLLVITGFNGKTPAWRVFLHKAGNKTRSVELGTVPQWSSKNIGTLLYGTSYGYYGINPYSYRINTKDKDTINRYFHKQQRYNQDNPLGAAADFQSDIRRRQKQRSEQMAGDAFQHTEGLVSGLPEDIDTFVQEFCMPGSRYIFYSKKERDGTRTGYCTGCGATMSIEHTVEHKQKDLCPSCCEAVEYRADWLSRSKLVGRCAFSIAQKGDTPHELIYRYYEVERDYNVDPRKVANKYMETARYYMNAETHKAYCFEQQWTYTWWYFDRHSDLLPRGFCHSRDLDPPRSQRIKDAHIAHYPLQNAIAGTVFERCGYDRYRERKGKDRVAPAVYLANYAKYPCIEYLEKMGFHNLVDQRLRGWSGRLKWTGATAEEVFRLPMQDIRFLRKQNPELETLELYRSLRLRGKSISRKDLECLTGPGMRKEDVGKLLGMFSPAKVTGYLHKQAAMTGQSGQTSGRSLGSICHDWVEYLDDVEREGLPRTDEFLRPANLYEAHTRIIAQKEDRDNPELNKTLRKLAKRYNRLYAFTWNGLTIRAAWSCGELILEGKHLGHCVGRYGSSVANKSCAIFFIRRTIAPDVPFCTLELRWQDKKQQEPYIAQCRGQGNSVPPAEVWDMIQQWKAEVLEPHNEQAETRITVQVAG